MFPVLFIACFTEYCSPPAYYICSFIIPVLQGLHCLYREGIPAPFLLLCGAVNTMLCIGVCMSVCLHRYFSHQAFKTSRLCQFVIGVVACFAWQGSPLFWAQIHIRHHKYCDKPNDPHSVTQQGFWYAFLGWMANSENYKPENVEYNLLDPDMLTLEMKMLHMLYPIPPLYCCFLVQQSLGVQVMVYALLLPMVICRFITLLFNVEFHALHEKKSDTCMSIDKDRTLAVLVGESRHNDHHKYPRKSRRPDLDIPYFLTIQWMNSIGLIWDCK